MVYKIEATERTKNYKTAFGLIENLLKDNFKRSEKDLTIFSGGFLSSKFQLPTKSKSRTARFLTSPMVTAAGLRTCTYTYVVQLFIRINNTKNGKTILLMPKSSHARINKKL